MGGLVVYWIAVCHLTFYTSLGWDVMEPLTYLASLSAIIVGYVFISCSLQLLKTNIEVLVPVPQSRRVV